MTTVQSVELESWAKFKTRLEAYFELKQTRRNQLIFRGHASSEWLPRTTLDRVRAFASDDERASCFKKLMTEFRREASGLLVGANVRLSDEDWELLARHHGLPTPILDWTTSPYVAAYFAFADQRTMSSSFVSVWVLDREAFAAESIPEIQIIDDVDRLQLNVRAIEQRGVFLRIGSTANSIEELLSKHLFRYDMPSSERGLALADLDQMLVNGRTLFRDLDGAARSATWRAMQEV